MSTATEQPRIVGVEQELVEGEPARAISGILVEIR
jgi:hypothetical protein